MVYDKDATYILPNDPPWCQLLAHSAAAAAPPLPAPTRDFHKEVKHLGWPGLWAGTGHPGGGSQRLQRDDTHQDKDLRNSLLSEPARIRGDLIDGTANQFWGSSGRHRNLNDGEDCQVGDIFHALPRSKCGKMHACHRTHLDPSRWIVT